MSFIVCSNGNPTIDLKLMTCHKAWKKIETPVLELDRSKSQKKSNDVPPELKKTRKRMGIRAGVADRDQGTRQ